MISMEKFEEKKVGGKTFYEGIVVNVRVDDVLLSTGRESKREVVEHAGGVVVVAQDEGRILVVRQYRYAVGEVLYELPAGKLEPGEDVLEAAKRELLEETGYTAEEWKSLGFIYPSAGISDERLYLYKAEGLKFVMQQPDEGEIIEYMKMDLGQVYEMIRSGIINDAKTICGVMRAFSTGGF